MGDVTLLHGHTVVEVLREALADAEAGKILAVVVVTELKDGTASWARGNHDDSSLWRLVGGLESAKHDLLNKQG